MYTLGPFFSAFFSALLRPLSDFLDGPPAPSLAPSGPPFLPAFFFCVALVADDFLGGLGMVDEAGVNGLEGCICPCGLCDCQCKQSEQFPLRHIAQYAGADARPFHKARRNKPCPYAEHP